MTAASPGDNVDRESAPPPMSVSEAKTRLLLFGEAQSLKTQIAMTKLRDEVRGAVPWAAGGAGLLGLLMAWRGKSRRGHRDHGRKGAAPDPSDNTDRKRAVVSWLVRNGIPIAAKVVSRVRARREQRRTNRAYQNDPE